MRNTIRAVVSKKSRENCVKLYLILEIICVKNKRFRYWISTTFWLWKRPFCCKIWCNFLYKMFLNCIKTRENSVEKCNLPFKKFLCIWLLGMIFFAWWRQNHLQNFTVFFNMLSKNIDIFSCTHHDFSFFKNAKGLWELHLFWQEKSRPEITGSQVCGKFWI